MVLVGICWYLFYKLALVCISLYYLVFVGISWYLLVLVVISWNLLVLVGIAQMVVDSAESSMVDGAEAVLLVDVVVVVGRFGWAPWHKGFFLIVSPLVLFLVGYSGFHSSCPPENRQSPHQGWHHS